jgi:hypothetical protein
MRGQQMNVRRVKTKKRKRVKPFTDTNITVTSLIWTTYLGSFELLIDKKKFANVSGI